MSHNETGRSRIRYHYGKAFSEIRERETEREQMMDGLVTSMDIEKAISVISTTRDRRV